MDWTKPPDAPAIIRHEPIRDMRFGLSIGDGLVRYDAVRLPRDYRDAKLAELLAWFPPELRNMPQWALQAMVIPGLGGLVGAMGDSGVRTVTFLTSTSAGNQTWSVRSDWNTSDNKIELVSHGGNGGNDFINGDTAFYGGGAGGGGYAVKANISLTPAGSMTYHLEAGGQGASVGQAVWANGASLAASSVGICGASTGSNASGSGDGGGGSGASTTGAIGDTKRAGGAGQTGGGGGGAAGPTGTGSAGGVDFGYAGGRADGDTVLGGASGTEWTSAPGGLTKGSGGGGAYGPATNGSLYGGGASGGGATGAQALIIITNNVTGS